MISYCGVDCSHFGYRALPEIRIFSSYHAEVICKVDYIPLKPCVVSQQLLPIQINYFQMFFNSYFALPIRSSSIPPSGLHNSDSPSPVEIFLESRA